MFTNPLHGDSRNATNKKNKADEDVKIPICITDYNRAKKDADIDIQEGTEMVQKISFWIDVGNFN